MVDFAADKKVSGGPAFDAVVGQRNLKDGLLAVAADDGLDGLLIRGEKGTAKSTAVRALSDLLPEQRAVADCPYGCPPGDAARQCTDCRDREDPPVTHRATPLVTLPLGATRDRVVGTLSVADALDGVADFDPGLLARANRGLLYVDEVNLLADHLVDVLLDAAASGVNRVERDGVAVSHPSQFTLVGSMNPEEGELRPQLRDRFALQTEVTACSDIDDRVAIIDGALGEEPAADEDATDGRPASERLRTARDRLPDVDLPRAFRERIARLCADADLDGHRGDIATARAARTFAALEDRTEVLEPDVERAARFALPHRLTSTPFEESPDLDDVLDEQFDDEDGNDSSSDAEDSSSEHAGNSDEPGSGGADSDGGESESDGEPGGTDSDGDATDEGTPGPDTADDAAAEESGEGAGTSQSVDGHDSGDERPADAKADGMAESDTEERTDDEDAADSATPLLPGQSRADIGDSAAPEFDAPAVDTDCAGASGRANATDTDRGAAIRTERAASGDTVDAAASVRATARRGGDAVESQDLRQSVRAGDAATLVVFAVDASASMRPAMRAAKGCVLELLEDAYQARDAVAVVTFAGEDAEVVLPPTDSVSLAARHLKELPTGDRTPLPAGLNTAAEVVTAAAPDAAVAVVITDGRANTADGSPVSATREAAARLGTAADRTVVVDTGTAGRATLTDAVAEATEATVVPLSALTAERIDAAARQ